MVDYAEDFIPFFTTYNQEADVSFQDITQLNSTTINNNNSTISENDDDEEIPDKESAPQKWRHQPSSFLEQFPSKTNHTSTIKAVNTINTGLWNKEECRLFIKGLIIYGTQWKKFEHIIHSRSIRQIRSHAQKFFDVLRREIKYSDSINEINNNIQTYFTQLLGEEIRLKNQLYSILRNTIFNNIQLSHQTIIQSGEVKSNKCKYFLIEKVAKINNK